jgi:hypothetical protein
MTVRVNFVGAAAPNATTAAPAAEDRHWEPVLAGAVVNYEQGRRFRVARKAARAPLIPARSHRALAAAAFDEDEPEVRVLMDSTGVFALDYRTLSLNGYPANVPIDQVSVHRHEFNEGTAPPAPPYETIELPIEVDDRNRNAVFDSTDRVVVFVQNWAQRSRASIAQRAWGDAEALYVTRLASGGKRLAQAPAWNGGLGLTALPSYPWTEHLEKNYAFYINFPVDTNVDQFDWLETIDYYTRADTLQFGVNDIDTTHAASFSLTFQGRRDESHITWAQIRNAQGQTTSVIDSLYWYGRGDLTRGGQFFGSALGVPRTPVILWAKTFFAPPDPLTNEHMNAGLKWMDLTYWRRYRPMRGYLSCNSGDQTGDFEIQAGTFNSATARVWDVSDTLNPVDLVNPLRGGTPGLNTVRLQGNAAAGQRQYVIFDIPKTVPASRYQPVTRRRLWAQPQADYLLIVPEALMAAAQPLATLRAAEGLRVTVAPLESVNDEFNGGRKSSYAIRRFIRYANDNWQSRFVLLFGDGSEDPMNTLGQAGPDLIPAQKILGPVGITAANTFAYEIVPSDMWYVWDVDGAPDRGEPLVPELFIGRLPVSTANQANAMVQKLIAYEQVDTTQTWRRRMMIMSDDAWSAATTFGGGTGQNDYCYRIGELVFRDISRTLKEVVSSEAGLTLAEPEVLDMNFLLAGEDTVRCSCGWCRADMAAVQSHAHAVVTPEMFKRLNDGRLWWNYQGHANAQVLAHEYVYRNFGADDDKDLFRNNGKPFLFTGFSCHPNAFAQWREGDPDIGMSIGEDLVNLPGGGAIASWASVGYELIPSQASRHLNVTMARSMFVQPPHDPYLGRGASAVLGEALALTLLKNYAYAETTGNVSERDVAATYTLLGDPATRITVGAPQIVVTANGQAVVDNEPVRLGSSGDSLHLEAELVSNAAITQITLERAGDLGSVIVPATDYTMTPAFPDTAPDGLGGRRYHLSYPTTVSGGHTTYIFRITDRYGVTSQFRVVFVLESVLQVQDRVVPENEVVTPDAALSVVVLSPTVVTNPPTDFNLVVDGVSVPFTALPARGDTTGRSYQIKWNHTPYAQGSHTVTVSVNGASAGTHTFQVVGGLRIAGLIGFPNPFDDAGTRFVFQLQGGATADLMLRVYTVSGRLIYERLERGVLPGSRELPWDGRDSEGDKLANGTYLVRMVAHGASGSASAETRLVKLRRPHRAAETP